MGPDGGPVDISTRSSEHKQHDCIHTASYTYLLHAKGKDLNIQSRCYKFFLSKKEAKSSASVLDVKLWRTSDFIDISFSIQQLL